MKKDDISRLLQRYLSAKDEGREPYFDADELDELLESFEESNDYTYFDEILALGLKFHPSNPALQIKQCRQYLYSEDYDSALTVLENIVDADSQDLDMIRLECLCSTNQYPKVLEIIEERIAYKCEYLEDLFEYITPVLNDLDKTADARDFADRGLTLFPDNLILKNELCYILEAEGDITKAIELCNELIDKNPFSYEYWFTLGRLHSLNAEYDKAIEAFDFALTCDDSDVELRILKAYCLYMNESYEKALEEYLEIEQDSDEEEVLFRVEPMLADCCIKTDRYEEAYHILASIVKRGNPEDGPATYIKLIHCCVETGRDEEATDRLLQAVEHYPDNVRLLTLLYLTHVQRGEMDSAEVVGKKMFDLVETHKPTPEERESLSLVAEYLFSNENSENVTRYYKRIINLKPHSPTFHLHMAKLALEAGNSKGFMQHIQRLSMDDLIAILYDRGINVDSMLEDMKQEDYTGNTEELVKQFLKNKENSN